MKRITLFVIVTIFCLHVSFADQIILRSADIIDGTVTMVGDEIVKYQKPGETFEREIAISNLFKIKYGNGEETVFIKHKTKQNNTSPQNVLVQTDPDWNAMPPASRVYHVGDWYSENGVEGVVIWTTQDGRHGKIVYPKTLNNERSAYFIGPMNVPFGMNDLSNGYANHQAVLQFILDNPQYSISMFPILEILLKIGDGWYLPAILELEYYEKLRDNKIEYMGENKEYNGKTVKWGKIIDSTAKAYGGEKVFDYYYLSSTEGYSMGGSSGTLEALLGEPQEPQFALYKREHHGKSILCVRSNGLTCIAFHLF